MAAITGRDSAAQRVVTRQDGTPQGSAGFDWLMIGLSALFLAGLWVDGWAHFHGEVDGSFFTPWHLLFYGSFAIAAATLVYFQVRNTGKGFAFTRALPRGYWLSLVGVGVFAVGGAGDMVWHTLFGIEDGSEALTSPTHLLLAIGMGLVFTGAMRSAWTRFPTREAARGWRDLGAMILGAALTLTLVMFFVSYGNPIVNPAPLLDFPTAFGMRDAMQDFGVTGVVFTAALFAAVVSLLAWRWRLPFGTFVVLFVVPTALLTVLNDFYPLIVPALVAGVIADVAYALLRPSPERGGRYLLFCGLAPLVYFSLYMVTLSALEPLRWSVHVWTGAAFLSGVVGVLLAGVISSAHSGTAVVD